MPSFKVQCPSCEAPVLIKNPNLVGTKVECPKCKYRFKVEEPAAEVAAAGADPTKDKDAAKEKDKKAEKKAKSGGGGKNKKLVPIVAGVVALVVLIGGAVAFLGGDGKKPKKDPFAVGSGPSRTGSASPEETQPEDGNKEKTSAPVTPSVPSSDKVTSNLLPGQAVAVYRINVDQLRGGPVYAALVDQPMTALFNGTLGFNPDDVDTYIHCVAGDGRDPFGVIKLKSPAKAADRLAKMPLKSAPKAVKGRDLHEFRSAPLLHAISHAVAMRSLFGDLYSALPPAAAAPPKDKPHGVCVLDTQHVLVGDYGLLERFLGELDANGYPPFKSDLDVLVVPATPPSTPPTDGAPAPAPEPAPTQPQPKPPAKQPASGAQTSSTINAYRTIEPTLKRALDDMEADRAARTVLVYAEKFDARQYDPKLLKKEYQILATTLDPIASRLRYIAANVTAFGYQQFAANVQLTLADVADARTLAKEKVAPGLTMVTELFKLYLTTPVEFRDYTVAGGGFPGTGQPGNGLPGMPPGSGFPGAGPGRFGPGGDGEEGRTPPGGIGPGRINPGSMGPGGAGPGRMGPGGLGSGSMGPGAMPGGMGSGSMGPGAMPGSMGPGGVLPGGEAPALPPSHFDLYHRDDQLLIAIDLFWNDFTYRTTVAPRVIGIANQIKGKVAVFSGEAGLHALATVAPRVLSTAKTTPRGTWDRAKSDPARLGLEYPPIQRVSLFAELLPHLGRGSLAGQIDRNAAWYALEYDPVDPNNPTVPPRKRVDNVTPGGEWIPELLVPSYPQSAWRATSPYAPDHTFGATNYVAIAGTGLNAARLDPNSSDPEVKKKLGMTGYNWGSRAEDVTDGLANTIYLMQTPPGLQQPWIAGGGATVRGFNEDDPMAGFRHANGGKPGTYALMGDGSVRFVPANVDKKVLLALGTRAGGDMADLADVNTAAPLSALPKPAGPVAPKPAPPAPENKTTTPPPAKTEPKGSPDATPAPREKKEGEKKEGEK
ncbi:hypothetical protein GobsT_18910 [Gemmata obscuriglobus]|uniref:DUF1559 domain-containing protein n=1 Tax=Gemmata obscuriglobus TaxID=114 RepID=A0A2Z3H898_9BACT|nr:DUF1559 domain-containing protein [Gemmata obscuriglobus]AWM39747.1 hypothetical protein C1280_23930 [Gemmata obscuriglobus]QEG27137.1 hypothetical protein GobsT_18910 [Gemmata obscuriglobus]VTS03708.1 : SBP_bac_10 [Gemmata obscuriglobus UQM 2246]